MKEMEELDNNQKVTKLYSQKAIGIATFMGAPLAASILIRHNYMELGKREEGKMALISGIVSTLILFIGIFMIPENIISKIPNQVIPLIYTAVIYFLVEKIQGKDIENHKANGHEFASNWKAAGIGFICLILILIPIIGYGFHEASNPAYSIYDDHIKKFTSNETESLEFYNHLNTNTKNSLLQELEHHSIPKWEENIQIIEKTNKIEDLPSELAEQNKVLLEYCKLRIEIFEMYKKAINDGSDKYSEELDLLHLNLEILLDKLK